MHDSLPALTRTLHDLITSLPAIRAHCSQEVLHRQLQLIEHVQRRYDRLVSARADPGGPRTG